MSATYTDFSFQTVKIRPYSVSVDILEALDAHWPCPVDSRAQGQCV